jgi:8-oxo-dGTP diphosphatase
LASDVVVDPGVEVPAVGVGEEWVVGAIIQDPAGRVFTQRRSADRRLFPGCWDLVGGHVEPGEDLLAALDREVAEETGWRLTRLRRLVGVFTWSAGDGRTRHEADFVVEVDGDLADPRLEWAKHPEYAWVGPGDLELLLENRRPGDTFVRDVVAEVFAH